MKHDRHYLVGMKVVKVESDEEFTVEDGMAKIRGEYPNDVITPIHPSKLFLFVESVEEKPQIAGK